MVKSFIIHLYISFTQAIKFSSHSKVLAESKLFDADGKNNTSTNSSIIDESMWVVVNIMCICARVCISLCYFTSLTFSVYFLILPRMDETYKARNYYYSLMWVELRIYTLSKIKYCTCDGIKHFCNYNFSLGVLFIVLYVPF